MQPRNSLRKRCYLLEVLETIHDNRDIAWQRGENGSSQGAVEGRESAHPCRTHQPVPRCASPRHENARRIVLPTLSSLIGDGVHPAPSTVPPPAPAARAAARAAASTSSHVLLLGFCGVDYRSAKHLRSAERRLSAHASLPGAGSWQPPPPLRQQAVQAPFSPLHVGGSAALALLPYSARPTPPVCQAPRSSRCGATPMRDSSATSSATGNSMPRSASFSSSDRSRRRS